MLGLQRGEDGFHLRVDLLVGEGAVGVAKHQREGEAVVSFGHGRACVAVKEAQRFQPRAARFAMVCFGWIEWRVFGVNASEGE